MTESISESISESLAAGAQRAKLSPAMAAVAERLLVDVAGLCVAARKADYVQAALAAWEADGRCTAIGHARTLDAAGGGVVHWPAPAGADPEATFVGVTGAPAAVSTLLGLSKGEFVNALGIAGSMASGIIEYLAEGAWTKRLHPGWAAQSGIRAADLARSGLVGPRSVFEGTHGFFHAFAHTT